MYHVDKNDQTLKQAAKLKRETKRPDRKEIKKLHELPTEERRIRVASDGEVGNTSSKALGSGDRPRASVDTAEKDTTVAKGAASAALAGAHSINYASPTLTTLIKKDAVLNARSQKAPTNTRKKSTEVKRKASALSMRDDSRSISLEIVEDGHAAVPSEGGETSTQPCGPMYDESLESLLLCNEVDGADTDIVFEPSDGYDMDLGSSLESSTPVANEASPASGRLGEAVDYDEVAVEKPSFVPKLRGLPIKGTPQQVAELEALAEQRALKAKAIREQKKAAAQRDAQEAVVGKCGKVNDVIPSAEGTSSIIFVEIPDDAPEQSLVQSLSNYSGRLAVPDDYDTVAVDKPSFVPRLRGLPVKGTPEQVEMVKAYCAERAAKALIIRERRRKLNPAGHDKDAAKPEFEFVVESDEDHVDFVHVTEKPVKAPPAERPASPVPSPPRRATIAGAAAPSPHPEAPVHLASVDHFVFERVGSASRSQSESIALREISKECEDNGSLQSFIRSRLCKSPKPTPSAQGEPPGAAPSPSTASNLQPRASPRAEVSEPVPPVNGSHGDSDGTQAPPTAPEGCKPTGCPVAPLTAQHIDKAASKATGAVSLPASPLGKHGASSDEILLPGEDGYRERQTRRKSSAAAGKAPAAAPGGHSSPLVDDSPPPKNPRGPASTSTAQSKHYPSNGVRYPATAAPSARAKPPLATKSGAPKAAANFKATPSDMTSRQPPRAQATTEKRYQRSRSAPDGVNSRGPNTLRPQQPLPHAFSRWATSTSSAAPPVPRDFQRFVELGKAKREKLAQEQQAAKAQAEQEARFKPRVSVFAAKRTTRSTAEYIQASERWQQRREAHMQKAQQKQEQELRPAVERSTRLNPQSERMAQKMEKENRRVGVVSGWEKRMEESKKRQDELQKQYQPTFKPTTTFTVKKDNSVAEEGARASTASVDEKSSFERSKKYFEDLFQRSIEEQERYQQRLERLRRERDKLPVQPKRNEKDIQEHVERLLQRDREQKERQSKRLERERQAEEEERLKAQRPAVNPRSAALAERYRSRHEVQAKDSPDVNAAAGADSSEHKHPKASSTSPSYAQPTAATSGAARKNLGNSAPSCREAAAAAMRPAAVVRTAPRRSHEFDQRTEKMLRDREARLESIRIEREKAEASECTFAPKVSQQSSKMADELMAAYGRSYADTTVSSQIRVALDEAASSEALGVSGARNFPSQLRSFEEPRKPRSTSSTAHHPRRSCDPHAADHAGSARVNVKQSMRDYVAFSGPAHPEPPTHGGNGASWNRNSTLYETPERNEPERNVESYLDSLGSSLGSVEAELEPSVVGCEQILRKPVARNMGPPSTPFKTAEFNMAPQGPSRNARCSQSKASLERDGIAASQRSPRHTVPEQQERVWKQRGRASDNNVRANCKARGPSELEDLEDHIGSLEAMLQQWKSLESKLDSFL